MQKPENVDQYISGFTLEIQDMIKQLRTIIRETVPDAVEMISYGMPAYKLNGYPLLYFAGHTNHLGFYPAGTSTVDVFAKAGFQVTKGSVHFPYKGLLPVELLREMIKFRASENMQKKPKKSKP